MPHAPGHLREAFAIWVDEGCSAPLVDVDADGNHIFYDEKPRSIRWLMGQLWHCSDIMPRDLCDELDMERGSTYAMAVHRLSKDGLVPVG